MMDYVLSCNLAHAIGHAREDIRVKASYGGGLHVLVRARRGRKTKWRVFDYRDPAIWGPVLEWLLCFGAVAHIDSNECEEKAPFCVWVTGPGRCMGASLSEAVARAAIGRAIFESERDMGVSLSEALARAAKGECHRD